MATLPPDSSVGVNLTPPPEGDILGWLQYERFYLFSKGLYALLAVAFVVGLWLAWPKAVRIFELYLPLCLPLYGAVFVLVTELVRARDWQYEFASRSQPFFTQLLFYPFFWSLLYFAVHGVWRLCTGRRQPRRAAWWLWWQFGLFVVAEGLLKALSNTDVSAIGVIGGLAVYLLAALVAGGFLLTVFRKRARRFCVHCLSVLLERDGVCRVCGNRKSDENKREIKP